MEFNHGIELLQLCEKTGLPISQIMKKREAVFSGITEEEVDAKMRKALEIMKQSVKEPLDALAVSLGEKPESCMKEENRGNPSAEPCFPR